MFYDTGLETRMKSSVKKRERFLVDWSESCDRMRCVSGSVEGRDFAGQ